MDEPKEISPWAAALMTAGGNILANNRPGVPYGAAIGSGISSFAPAYYATKGAQDRQKYIDTLQKYKQLEYDAEQAKAQQEAAQKQHFASAVDSGSLFQNMNERQKSHLGALRAAGDYEGIRDVLREYSKGADDAPTTGAGGVLQWDQSTGQWSQIPGALALKQQLAAASAPRTSVVNNVNMKGATKASEAMGQAFGEFAAQTYTSADKARSTYETINRVNKLLDGVSTGPGAESLAKFKASANMMMPGVFDTDNISSIEAAQSEAGKLVMELLNEMKGAAQVEERKYLQDITLDVAMSPEGRKRIEQIAEAQDRRQNSLADKLTDVAIKVENGEITTSEGRKLYREAKRGFVQGGPDDTSGSIGKMDAFGLQKFIESKGGEENLTPDERAAIEGRLQALGF